MKTLLALLLALGTAMTSLAQENPLAGVIDIHVHWRQTARRAAIDALDPLHALPKRGACVAWCSRTITSRTASLAYGCAQRGSRDRSVWRRGISNLSVGGMNPSAVEHMAATTAGFGRFVWMSTFDSEAQVRYFQARPAVRAGLAEWPAPS